MSDNSFLVLYKLRFILGSLLIVGCLFLLSFILSITSTTYKVHAAPDPNIGQATSNTVEDPNIISNLMSDVGNKSMHALSSTQQALNNSVHGVTSTLAPVPVQSFKVLSDGAQSSASFITDSASSTVKFVAQVPHKVLRPVSPPSIIRPADNSVLPKINAPTTTTTGAQNADVPAPVNSNQAVSSSDTSTQWPIHGAITTYFGVPERPYQPIHTGIDISDGKRSGATKILPFKPGKVVLIRHSSQGLGNQVVVDHGGGMTSVYGHLYSISVQAGQSLDKNTIIGTEGSTGASTGTHLHFEIRINGRAQNPLQFIPGRP